jgi:type IV pilus assembly protein PilQ
MNRSFRIATALLLLGALGSTVQAQIPSQEVRVTLNVAERPLELIVDFLREKSGANIEIIDGTEPDDVISTSVVDSLQLTQVHWKVALEIAAEKVGAVVESRPGGVWIVTKPPRVYYDAKDQDIADVIDLIARQAEANVVVAPEVTGTVSVRFNGVPWKEALDVLAKTRGFTVVEEKGGVLRVVDPIVLQDQLVTQSYQLRYLRPASNYAPQINSEFILGNAQPPKGDAWEHFTVLRSLSKALSSAGQMDYIERQNVVIVRDTQQVHEMISDIIETLDVEPRQIFCDVKFVTTLNSDMLNLGVDYGDGGPQISYSGGQIPITFPFNQGSGGWEDSIIASPDGSGPYVDGTRNGGGTFVPDTIFGALNFTNWQGTLRLLQRDTSAEVVQAPKVITLDGNEATIFVGETVRYAEAKSEQGQAGGLQLTIQEASGSPVEIGFQLLIKPHVIPGTSNVQMEVIPKETSLTGTGDSQLAPEGFDVFTIGAVGLEGSIALPRTRSSTVVTTMMVESGQTAVIGGLSTDIDTETETRVPGLWRIPLVGELFKHKTKNRERRNMMVFVTPTIVHSTEDHERLLRQELERRRSYISGELEAMLTGELTGDDPSASDMTVEEE